MPQQPIPKIELSERVRKIVEEMAKKRSTESRLVIRALLLLAMTDGAGNSAGARQRKLDRGVVRCWRTRWIDLLPRLNAAESSGIEPEHWRDLIGVGLSDLPRRGTPPPFTAEQIVQIVALGC